MKSLILYVIHTSIFVLFFVLYLILIPGIVILSGFFGLIFSENLIIQSISVIIIIGTIYWDFETFRLILSSKKDEEKSLLSIKSIISKTKQILE